MSTVLNVTLIASALLALSVARTRTCGQDANGSGAESSLAAAEAEQRPYVLSGDLSALFASGTLVIYADSPGGATRVELVDGRFRIEGSVARPHAVHFHVADGRTHEGYLMGQVKGQSFLLEPGELTMTMGDNYDWIVRGPYNDAVFNSWKQSDAYLAAKQRMAALFSDEAAEGEEADRDKRILIVQNELLDLEARAREKTAMTHPDLLVRELAITTSSFNYGWEPEAARGILEQDPENAWAREFLAAREARQEKLDSAGAGVEVGDYALYFDAETLAGEDVSLWQVCGEKRYVLLEFWASWCGPCRAELPHLKKAYAAYRERGFEIFSVTIDADRAAWAKASREEQLPWIDSGFGAASKPQKLYRVTGVPNNYLIDCKTGKVIAKNLRGDDLADRLEQLYLDVADLLCESLRISPEWADSE